MKTEIKIDDLGSFLVVQWLGLGIFIAVAQVQSLVREMRSYGLHGAANSNNNNKKTRKVSNHDHFITLSLGTNHFNIHILMHSQQPSKVEHLNPFDRREK